MQLSINKAYVKQEFDRIDIFLTKIMRRISPHLLRWSIGIVFIWFGALKPFGLSPANELVRQTTDWIFDYHAFIIVLGIWEILIGIFFIIPKMNRIAIFLLALQMPGTMLPIFVVPSAVFTHFPYGLTLEGQYIVKNLVLIAAAISIGARVRETDLGDI